MDIVIGAAFAGDQILDVVAPGLNDQTFLNALLDAKRGDVMLLVVGELLCPALLRDFNHPAHGVGDFVGVQNDFAIQVSGGAARGLDE